MRGDTAERYGSITRWFHWGMAVLIIWQMLKFFDRISEGEHWVGQRLVPWHVSIGTLLLILVVARIIWKAKQRTGPAHDPATAFLVKAGHVLLYVGMVLMPVTGVLTMLGGGFGWTAFGIQLAARGEKVPWMSTLGSLHSPIAWIMLILVLGHIGIALVHHFVKQDDVLRRIL